MRRNPVICLIVAGLLIFSLIGPAAAALRMACEGTAACCCARMAAESHMAADMAPMNGDCCATPKPLPCDLAVPVSSPAAPFLPTGVNTAPDIGPALSAAGATSVHTIAGGAHRGTPIRPPSLVAPPLYLQTQTFLC